MWSGYETSVYGLKVSVCGLGTRLVCMDDHSCIVLFVCVMKHFLSGLPCSPAVS